MVIASESEKPRLIRLSHPLAFAAFLKHIGAPAERFFRRQGLPVLCDDPDVFVPLQSAWGLFDAATRSEDPMLGWYVGRFVGDHNLNATLLRKLENAPTLYQALREFIELVGSEASHLRYEIQERRDDILFVTHYPDMKGVRGYAVSQAYQIEALLSLFRHFIGQHWYPEEVGLECAAIPLEVRDRLPGTRVLTGQRTGYIAIPRACLHLTVRRNETDDVVVDDVGDSLVMADQLSYVDTLKSLLQGYLADGYPTEKIAARLMDTSERTLTRRLSSHGFTYLKLLDEVRFEMARKLLFDAEMRIEDVAGTIGFSDPSHFARMFRRIGGLSPTEFRKMTRS
jgi:AraC-like DNA-binding protein